MGVSSSPLRISSCYEAVIELKSQMGQGMSPSRLVRIQDGPVEELARQQARCSSRVRGDKNWSAQGPL